MVVDWGVVFGLTGVAVGLVSLIYARTQALDARRQADAAHLASTLHPVFQSAVARQALEPELVAFLRPVFDGQALRDPKPASRVKE